MNVKPEVGAGGPTFPMAGLDKYEVPLQKKLMMFFLLFETTCVSS